MVGKRDIIELASSYIFHVTGVHHTVGNVAEYLMAPEFASGRIRPGREISDVEASMYALLSAVMTGARAPKLMQPEGFTHILLQDEHHNATREVFLSFQRNLTALSREIDAMNEKRHWPFYGFQPSRMLSSVSI